MKKHMCMLLGVMLLGSVLRAGLNDNLLEPLGVKNEPSYGLVSFEKLPEPKVLLNAGVVSLNYVDEHTIYGSVQDFTLLEKVEGYQSFELLSADYKLDPNLSMIEGTDRVPVFIYLPSNFTDKNVSKFVLDNKIKCIESENLPTYVILAVLTKSEIVGLLDYPYVSYVSKVSDAVISGKPFHFCLGALTEYGHVGEFAKYATVGDGWDGPGLGCSNLTYAFENGTNDIVGNNERIAVINALKTWQKYVSISLTEVPPASSPWLTNIEFSWEVGLHPGIGCDPYSPFDGPGGILAHAYVPTDGRVHFDDDELWSLTSTSGLYLYTYALHEIGHALGMNHSAVTGSVMQSSVSGVYTDLHADDIAGIRTLYKTRNINTANPDRTFIANVTGDSDKEIVMVNTSLEGDAIRVDNLLTGANLKIINLCSLDGMMDPTDRMFMGDVNGDGYKDLIFINTQVLAGALIVQAVDLTTGSVLSSVYQGSFGGWFDPNDKTFVGDVNNDGKEDLILVNTGYAGGAIRTIDVMSGSNISLHSHTGGGYGGWMDNTDRMLVADVNNDNETDLILVNTSYSGGAIRTVDLTSGTNLGLINHSASPNFNGWMDATDKMSVADINGDGLEELILVNTSYTGGAIRSINVQTGVNLTWLSHSSPISGYAGMMDACDRMFMADVDEDGSKDMVFVMTAPYATFRVINVSTGNIISSSQLPSPSGWADATDYMFCESINTMTDESPELIFVNTSYSGGAITKLNLWSGAVFSTTIMHVNYTTWMDGTSIDQNCNSGPIFKSAEVLDDSMSVEFLADSFSNAEDFVKVYPNPAVDELTIVIYGGGLSDAIVKVWDLSGKMVFETTDLKYGENVISLEGMEPGLYLVEVTRDKQVKRIKVQVVR